MLYPLKNSPSFKAFKACSGLKYIHVHILINTVFLKVEFELVDKDCSREIMRKVPSASQNIAKVVPIPVMHKGSPMFTSSWTNSFRGLSASEQKYRYSFNNHSWNWINIFGELLVGHVSIDTSIMITAESQRILFYFFRLEQFYNICVNYLLNILRVEA